MPKTPRSMSSAPSTISKPPVSDSVTPVSASFAAPVIASDSALASSSGSDITNSGSLMAMSSATEPLSGGQTDSDLFRKFKLFVEWERSSLSPPGVLPSPSSATTVSFPSVRPIYTLAPSALSHPTNPPRSDLGSIRSSPTLASSRGQGAHVLPLREVPSRATRQPSSVARSGTVQSDNGGRTRASLSRGVFVERDALMASGDQSLADYYVDDLDFTSAIPSLVVNSLLLIPRFWIARQKIANQMILLVLLRTRLAFRLRPSCAVIWGTCIALTEK